jgi:hypothetical protein
MLGLLLLPYRCLAEEMKAPHPSTAILPLDAFEEGWGVLSLVVDKADLYSPERGIVTHFLMRGREWERTAHATYYRPGSRVPALEFAAGIRVHGMSTRHREKKRFRLYFRKSYGMKKLPAGAVFPEEVGPQRSIVVRRDNDLRPYPYNSFASPIAFEIARKIGAEVPHYVPVRLYLNGEFFEYYYLVEHLSKKNMELRLGHEDFEFHVYKNEEAPPETFTVIDRELRFVSPLTAERVEQSIDLDNMFRYLFATAYCATNDSFQGVLYRNNREESPRWRWIVWDMDASFVDYGAAFKQGKRELWEQESWEHVLSDRDYRNKGQPSRDPSVGDIRAVLFTRLLYDDPVFKAKVVKTVEGWLDNELSEQALLAMGQGFRKYLKDKYTPDRDEFFKSRGKLVRKEMHRIFDGLPYWKAKSK